MVEDLPSVDAQPDGDPELTGAAIRQALTSRVDVARATGVLMARGHLTAQDAAALLLEQARLRRISLVERAQHVLRTTDGSRSPLEH